MVRHPRGSYIVYPMLSLEVVAMTQINQFDAVIHMQESPSHKLFGVRCSSPFMRLVQPLMALRV